MNRLSVVVWVAAALAAAGVLLTPVGPVAHAAAGLWLIVVMPVVAGRLFVASPDQSMGTLAAAGGVVAMLILAALGIAAAGAFGGSAVTIMATIVAVASVASLSGRRGITPRANALASRSLGNVWLLVLVGVAVGLAVASLLIARQSATQFDARQAPFFAFVTADGGMARVGVTNTGDVAQSYVLHGTGIRKVAIRVGPRSTRITELPVIDGPNQCAGRRCPSVARDGRAVITIEGPGTNRLLVIPR